MQEDETRLKDSKPVKLAAFRMLLGAGASGMRAADIIAALKALPEHADWDVSATRYLRNVCLPACLLVRCRLPIHAWIIAAHAKVA